MKIAMIGQKGIPATYGGIERHVEELSARLVGLGHDVTVYCRPHYTKSGGTYRGVRLAHTPSINTKHLDAISHTCVSTLAAVAAGADIIHYHALGPSVMSFIPAGLGRKIVATVHGLDWQRDKWGRASKAFLKLGEWCSARFPNRTIVVSKTLKKYYDGKYGMESVYIPNGIQPPAMRPAAVIREKFGLESGGYFLFVGRLVPEKGCDSLVEAFRGVDTDKKLVIAGGSSHSDEYEESLKSAAKADPRIIFTGYVYGETLEELYGNAFLYVQPSLIEGLPIALLEALSYGKPALISDIPENVEVVDGLAGIDLSKFTFRAGDSADLRARLTGLLACGIPDGAGDTLRGHVFANYDWDDIARSTAKVYEEVSGGR